MSRHSGTTVKNLPKPQAPKPKGSANTQQGTGRK